MVVSAEHYQAFVLHTRPYLETSLLVELFTKELGRCTVIAKGARRGHDARRGLLQACVPLWVYWRGRGELPTLFQVEANGPPSNLKGEGLFCALYMNEILYRLLPKYDSLPLLFTLYQNTLELIAQQQDIDHQGWPLRRFESAVLTSIGLGLDCYKDASGSPIHADKMYVYESKHGFVASRSGYSGQCILSLEDSSPPNKTVALQAKYLMRQLLTEQLGPLKARSLF